MDKFWESFQNIDYSSLPIGKLILVAVILILAAFVQQSIKIFVVRRLEGWFAATETTLDDEALAILKPTIGLLVFLGALWLIPLVFVGELSPELNQIAYGALKILTLVALIYLVYRLSSVLGLLATAAVLHVLNKVTGKSDGDLKGKELTTILRASLRLLSFLVGLWAIQQLFSGALNAQVNETFSKGISLLAALTFAYVIYRSASVLGQIIANLLLAGTDEHELIDVIAPFLPKMFQAIAIVVILIKGSEFFFGGDTGPLLGLLGGAGLTLGLLFKDIIYDWFCTIVIFTDRLYREGDWVSVSGISGFVEIKEIGFRTTTLHVCQWGSIIKMPNSRMITGIVENWSQNPGKEDIWGITLKLKIDGISAETAERICEGLKQIHGTLVGVNQACTIRFMSIEGNARVFELRVQVNDTNLYYDVERSANLAILRLLDAEGIDALHVELEADPYGYTQRLQEQTRERHPVWNEQVTEGPGVSTAQAVPVA